jgi:septum formation inhibitor-activating ATPase MinD
MFQSAEAAEMGLLRDLHKAIKQTELALISVNPTIQSIRNYEKVSQILSKMYQVQTSYSWSECNCVLTLISMHTYLV